MRQDPACGLDFNPTRTHVSTLGVDNGEADSIHTPFESSTSVISEGTDAAKPMDGEFTTAAPGVFDDEGIGTPQMNARADLFSSSGTVRNLMLHVNLIPIGITPMFRR